MKRFYLFLFLCLFLFKSKAQQTLPNYYNSYFTITDSEKSFPLNKRNSGFRYVFGESREYSGENHQQWLIMPVSPNSDEYIIANKQDGSLLSSDLSPIALRTQDNYFRNDFQLFKLTPVSGTTNHYVIRSKINPERVLSRESRVSGMVVPRNAIRFRKYTGQANQHFEISTAGSFPIPITSYRPPSDTDISLPPGPNNLRGDGLCTTCGETFIAETILPFAMIRNDLSRKQQSSYHPYYRLEYSRHWRLLRSRTFPAGMNEVGETEQSVGGFASESARQLGISVSPDSEICYQTGDIAGKKIAEAIAASLGKPLKEIRSHTENETHHRVWPTNISAAKNMLIAEYLLIDRYALYRNDGTKVFQWDVVLNHDFSIRMAHVDGEKGWRILNGQPGRTGQKSLSLKSQSLYSNQQKSDGAFIVNGIYPNPFQSAVKVDLSVPEAATITANVYNLMGQKIKSVSQKAEGKQACILEIEGSELPNSIYILKVEAVAINDHNKKWNHQQKIVLQK